MANLGKSLLIAGGITLGAAGFTFLGEKTQPINTVKESIAFHNVGPAPTTPDNYKLWHVEVEKDANLDAIVKITDDSTTYILNKNLGPVTAKEQQEYLSVVGNIPAEGTPRDFLAADIAYKLNDQGQVEVYFGNKETRQYWRVNENWTAGDVGEQVDKFFEKMFRDSKNIFETKQNIKEKAVEGWNEVDSLYNEKKEQFSVDSVKTNFWQKIKENTIETYDNIKECIHKK